MPIQAINFNPICDPGAWETTKHLLKLWSNEVGIDIEYQIKNWNKNSVNSEKGMSPNTIKK